MSAEINLTEGLELEPIVGPVEIDVYDQFATNRVFEQRDDLIKWAREIARGLGFILTIQKSDGLDSRACPRVFLGCDRSGNYRENQSGKSQIKRGIRRSSTKRCGCPFALKGQKVAKVDQWKVEVVCGMHNHTGSTYLEGNAFDGRLDKEQKNIVKEMSLVGMKPRDCLQIIKKMDPTNLTTMKTIYNARAAIRLEELGGRSPIQHLFKCLDDLGYVTFHRIEEKSNNLTDLFFAHPTSIELSITFPSVFLLDCTYKINRFRLPLLSIVGVTSTDQIFISAFAFLSQRDEPNHIWALECFKSILAPGSLPLVLVTNCEMTLINAIKSVFPTSKNLLCLSHISKKVLANCKEFFVEEETIEKLMKDWNALTRSPTESDYNHALISMERDFSLYPNALNYVTITWLNPYKELFVAAWTDQHFHLGNTSTSRVETAHSQLKRYLQVSTSNLTTAWKSFDSLINQQYTDIKSSFSASRIKIHHAYNDVFYNQICGHVSNYALGKIKEQKDLAESYQEGVMIDVQECQHVIRRTMGIPCAHELVVYIKEGKALPLSMIHDHWKKLTFVDEPLQKDLYKDITPAIEMIIARYSNANECQKAEMKRKLHEIADPTSIQMKEPVMPAKRRGRPKGSIQMKEPVMPKRRGRPKGSVKRLQKDITPTKQKDIAPTKLDPSCSSAMT